MKQRAHRVLFWSIAFSGSLLDQAGKYIVFRWLYHDGHGGEWDIFPGVFRIVAQFKTADPNDHLLSPLRTWGGMIQPRVNPGALFSLGVTYAHVANITFALVSSLVVVGMVTWSWRRKSLQDHWLTVALGLILAGTMGNLYDRCVFGGVRDFLYFYWINWPIFNFADCFLVCGAGLLLAKAFWKVPAPEGQADTMSSSAGAAAESK
ncbi:MAG TPA: signal peptidase II [Gemmataceae bacterium]|nr:signal peptidase II [Gemmataceae bacterium]